MLKISNDTDILNPLVVRILLKAKTSKRPNVCEKISQSPKEVKILLRRYQKFSKKGTLDSRASLRSTENEKIVW